MGKKKNRYSHVIKVHMLNRAKNELHSRGLPTDGDVVEIARRLGSNAKRTHSAWRFLARLALGERPHIAVKIKPPKKRDFYFSPEWLELRYRAIKKYGRKCMCCGATDKPIHVDHIKPRSRFPDLALDITNLQILCRDCNLGKGAWDKTDWRPKEATSS